MTRFLFPPPQIRAVPVRGIDGLYPVNRVFCVGRNYGEHAREMGLVVDRDAPFYFTKSVAHIALSGETAPYPPATGNFHHEIELVIAIGAPAFKIAKADAGAAILGFACGLDMTRRDLQQAARSKQLPWDIGKNVEHSAVISTITPAAKFGPIGPQAIRLSVNGVRRQNGLLSDLIWSVEDLVSHLSGLYHLAPGDLIYTGTPAGVGAVVPGDRIEGSIDGLDPVSLVIGPPV